jgi:pSer/pThr/pTyr-binding forkhead associated (FHA) protein
MHIILKFNDSVVRQISSDKTEITIGRDPDTDIQIDNISVSRVHAKIQKEPKQYVLHDLNSTNGTFVNGKKIKKKSLKEDDVITIGKHTLLVDINNCHKKDKMWSSSQTDRTYKLKNMPPGK